MSEKMNQAMQWTISLFVGGIVISSIGLAKGRDIASFFSRPNGADFWTISDGAILAATFIPVLIGVSMMVLAMLFVTVLFLQWFREPAKHSPKPTTESAQTPE